MVKIIVSNRGGQKLVDNLNYIYRVNKRAGNKTIWKCDIKECKARIHTVLENEDLSVLKTHGDHYHPSQPGKPEVLKKLSQMKSLALTTQMSPESIVVEGASGLDDNLLPLLPNSSKLYRNIKLWRSKDNPILPTSSYGYEIPHQYQILDNGENFLLYDSGSHDPQRLLIFCSQAGLEDLQTNSNWACDGTFRSTPNILYEAFALYVVVDNTCILRLFALLPGRSKQDYKYLFRILKEMNPSLHPCSLMIDFEKNLLDAFLETFPQARARGCLFHLSKDVDRQLVDKKYSTSEEFKLKIKCLTALAFLPVSDVVQGFVELTGDEEFPQELVSYFESIYIGGEKQPTFPVELWNVNEETRNGITQCYSSVINYHNTIQSSISVGPSNLWKFVNKLTKEETGARKQIIEIQRGEGTRKYQNIDEKLRRLVINYNSNDKKSFLKSIASNLHLF